MANNLKLSMNQTDNGKIKKIVLLSSFCLLFMLNGCKYQYTEFVTDLNDKTNNNIVQDSLIKFKCEIPKLFHGTFNLILNFKTIKIYKVDSLDISVMSDNNKELILRSLEKDITDKNGLESNYFHDTINNKYVYRKVNENLTSINTYPINYKFSFTIGKAFINQSIILKIKALLTYNEDSLRYYKKFKLYARQIEYYD